MIAVVVGEDDRRFIRLGQMTGKQADTVKLFVEDLAGAKLSRGGIKNATAEWLADLGDVMHKKLAKAGLVEPRRIDQAWTFAAWATHYIAARTDAKESTVCNLRQAERAIVEHFGRDRLLKDIGPGDSVGFVAYLRKKLAEATVRRQCGRVKQFFNAAVKAGVITQNPFAGVKSADFVNRDRAHEVTVAEVRAILDSCPDVQWRMVVGLAYYAGLRCPTEILALRWGDVNWATKFMRVHSSKTERESGGGVRDVPLCPELLTLLLDGFAQAEPGAEYAITRYRCTRSNLRTQLGRIMDKAGVKRFPKACQNMRATAETNWLALGVAESQVSEWIGHRVEVGRKHYHQSRAAWADLVTGGASESASPAHQNAHQHPDGQKRTAAHGEKGTATKPNEDGPLCATGSDGSPECANSQSQESSPTRTRT